MKIVIFSGTTEGRRLSEMLSAEGIRHIVCVATKYGDDVMQKSDCATVHIGRMDSAQMSDFFRENGIGKKDIIVDATHPYACEVSRNIAAAAGVAGCELIVVYRDARSYRGSAVGNTGDLSGYDHNEDNIRKSYVNQSSSVNDLSKTLDTTEGNILLTTGSKELETYCKNVSAATLSRTYVRVLPAMESLEICSNLGIETSHVIAMQGPFTYEMNRALIAQYDIKHLITKDSGTTGGYYEKIRAAEDSGTTVYVIKRPETVENAEGISVEEAYGKITGKAYIPKRKIMLAGIGMGAPFGITPEVADAIRCADAVFGARRVLEAAEKAGLIRTDSRYDMYLASDICKVLDESVDITTTVVLFSGDTGFYSGAKEAYSAFKEWYGDAELTVLPGTSSVSCLAAKLGESYDDAAIVSVHGRNGLHNLLELAERIRYNRKTFALVSGAEDIRKIAGMLNESRISVEICIGRNLSYVSGSDDDNTLTEEILTLDVKEALKFNEGGSITVLFINEDRERRKLIPRFADDDFIRDDVPMTKECIRHESIGRLDLREGDVVYDIGGGTGSVALEIASIDPSLKVTTIEKEHDACELIRRNIEKLRLYNVDVIEGDAAEVLENLPKPDRVFIGGSGGKMRRIIETIAQKGGPVRLVVNAVSLETIGEMQSIMADINAKDQRIVQISVSDINTAGSHHMLKAQNPVTIFSFSV